MAEIESCTSYMTKIEDPNGDKIIEVQWNSDDQMHDRKE
jgi:hypothetical protein